MVRREMGKTGEKVSALGFGCMRLPTLDSGIDIPEATRMLRHAIDNGVDYVDTAWGYHNGQSEPFVGEALKDGYREKVNLATKLPSWLIKSHEDMDHY
ncbi:MAG TPA: aldo/keto reductase, partial [Mesotoga sp.]|nr:aldo/keto reductase [Mesotoga sp.]